MRSLVYGLAVTGASTVRALAQRGHDVVVVDDQIDDAKRALAAELGVELLTTPASLEALVGDCDLVSPSPGVPETHDVVAAARRRGVPVRSEIELAYQWEQDRPGGARPILAITGTDGKTTTTLLAAAMLTAAGLRAVAAGNTDVPLVDALDMELDAYVVECSSFRLAWTEQFRANAALWLNLAPDHLNWHRSMATYEAAKARLFDLQRPSDVAIGYVDDPVVMGHLDAAPARHVTFGRSTADYHVDGDTLRGPTGTITTVASMRRRLPHDITNALAASALVFESGLADLATAGRAITAFVGPPHRIEPVGERDGVQWFNDSKATTPHAVAVAIHGFEHVVLIAGGRNKDLDLSPMAAEPQRLRSVVAIGESAAEIAELFAPHCTVVRADSMEAAVLAAADAARRGDAVLLSPGCASFDWYPSGGYGARGDHFRRLVADLVDVREVGLR
ncbi:MAG TPA: UDP-N-acetylmuramoyl-L-alanine--D-glutamate ligase [Ilumatobacteraceae bacterium]|nr:UDP-N-acetylmuramoyl-L-alanine--D-glutamate ligase [Ilumatobacteraceae bacterium]